MKPSHWIALAVAGAAFVATSAAWAADSKKSGKGRNTPSDWSYELKNGKPVPRVPRKVNADGSWTEELHQGNCIVTRTGRNGEIRETRKCG